jgi:signal transduction histidine kinase
MTDSTALATARGEQMLSRAVALFRLGSLLLLLGAVVLLRPGSPPFAPLMLIAVLAGAQTVAFAVTCWRIATVPAGLVGLDLLGTVLVLALSSSTRVVPGPAGQSPFYNYALFASFEAGMLTWRLWAVLACATLFALVTLGSSDLLIASRYPLWNAVPDAFVFPASTLITWIGSQLVRYVHREQDSHRLLAAQRAADLARARERARQSVALGAGLISTLETVLAADAVADSALAGRIRLEAGWLRRVVEAGLTDTAESLLDDLRDLAQEKLATGLQVRLHLPEREPSLTAAARAALLGGAREALTNVAKHSRVNIATLAVAVADGWVSLEVTDQGKGYEPTVVPPGTGQRGSILRRLAEAGGRAIVQSTPGRGTRVILRIPEDDS